MKQTRFVLIVMYDIPMVEPKGKKAYRELSQYLKKQGFYLWQQSIYIKPLSEKKKAKRYLTAIHAMSMPVDSHIRAIVITHQLFLSIFPLKGEDSFGESLIKQPNGVIVI